MTAQLVQQMINEILQKTGSSVFPSSNESLDEQIAKMKALIELGERLGLGTTTDRNVWYRQLYSLIAKKRYYRPTSSASRSYPPNTVVIHSHQIA
jgi:hypothetical protein